MIFDIIATALNMNLSSFIRDIAETDFLKNLPCNQFRMLESGYVRLHRVEISQQKFTFPSWRLKYEKQTARLSGTFLKKF